MEVAKDSLSTMKGNFPKPGMVVVGWITPKNWDDEAKHPAVEKFELRDEASGARLASLNESDNESGFGRDSRKIEAIVDLNGDGVDEVITRFSHSANGGYFYEEGQVLFKKGSELLEAGVFSLKEESDNENGESSCENNFLVSKPNAKGLRDIVVSGTCPKGRYTLENSKFVKVESM